MSDTLRWLLLPVIIGLGWVASRTHEARARKAARCLALIAGALLVLLGISGLLRGGGLLADIHRWTGHAVVIVLWLGVPFAIGVTLQQDLTRRPVAAVVQVLALLLGLAIALAASMTGYLGPTNSAPVDPAIDQETYNRFRVLHFVVLPGLCAALMVQWWWYFRARGQGTAS